jgi:hypothetical protein
MIVIRFDDLKEQYFWYESAVVHGEPYGPPCCTGCGHSAHTVALTCDHCQGVLCGKCKVGRMMRYVNSALVTITCLECDDSSADVASNFAQFGLPR